MDSEENRSVVLLPIKPEFAMRILHGEKRVEFRKRRFHGGVKHVVIYASYPVKQVIGFFTIAGIDEASPASLWRKYRNVGGISKETFEKYYGTADRAIGIRVQKVVRLSKPVSLEQLGIRSGAPQSFSYLPLVIFNRLVSKQSGVYG